MKEKQYCNLTKRILRGLIDLDDLGDTDSMNLGTLLEISAQKVIEDRMKNHDEVGEQSAGSRSQRSFPISQSESSINNSIGKMGLNSEHKSQVI